LFDPPRAPEYTIWAVAFVLFLTDAARLLSAREVLLVEAGRGRLAAAFTANPYTLGGRVLSFGPLHLPHRGVFVAPWNRAWSDAATVQAVVDRLRRLAHSLLVPRVIAAGAFCLLFVLGPALTFLLGVGAAVVLIALAAYTTVIVAIGFVWWKRATFGLSARKATFITLELLACPAFLPNLVRKITTSTPIDADAAQLVLATSTEEMAEAFLARLEARTEALLGEASPDESLEGDLRAYLTAVRSGR
jgi:hypothetical protein